MPDPVDPREQEIEDDRVVLRSPSHPDGVVSGARDVDRMASRRAPAQRLAILSSSSTTRIRTQLIVARKMSSMRARFTLVSSTFRTSRRMEERMKREVIVALVVVAAGTATGIGLAARECRRQRASDHELGTRPRVGRGARRDRRRAGDRDRGRNETLLRGRGHARRWPAGRRPARSLVRGRVQRIRLGHTERSGQQATRPRRAVVRGPGRGRHPHVRRARRRSAGAWSTR